jgi:hypothetical protein
LQRPQEARRIAQAASILADQMTRVETLALSGK